MSMASSHAHRYLVYETIFFYTYKPTEGLVSRMVLKKGGLWLGDPGIPQLHMCTSKGLSFLCCHD